MLKLEKKQGGERAIEFSGKGNPLLASGRKDRHHAVVLDFYAFWVIPILLERIPVVPSYPIGRISNGIL